MSAINNTGQMGQVNFDKLSAAYPSKPSGAGSSALKGSMEVHEMQHRELQDMMKELTPHLGQNVDMEA